MKKLLVAAALTLSYGTAYAGMYHAGAANICADCHTMHGSMAHDYAGNATTSTTPKALADGSWLPASGVPADYLLKGSETSVCTACHDGQTWAPDVVDTNTNSYVRSAGFLPAAAGSGHTMGFAGTAPGGVGAIATFTDFTCVSCHSPHGKADAFRNLNAYGLYGSQGDSTGYPKFYLGATPFATAAMDARIDATYAAGTGDAAFLTHIPYYSNANVNFENGDVSLLDKYCGKCHGNFHDNSMTGNVVNAYDSATDTNQVGSAAGVFKRHPTRVAISRPPTAGGATTKIYKTATGNYVGCLSCHKAHGTANPFGLFYAVGATNAGPNVLDNTESGAGAFGGSCSNCHGQAR